MDALLGYSQIKMVEADQEKTSFITNQGLFYYKVMSFGLKNAGTTYQRLMNKMFAHPNQCGNVPSIFFFFFFFERKVDKYIAKWNIGYKCAQN